MSTERNSRAERHETISRLDRYKEASECCRLYSELTMKVRTLAQQVVIGYAVGLGLFLSRSEWPPALLDTALIGAGLILVLFSLPLWLLNQHYSTAFEAIRDKCLVPLEDLAPIAPGEQQSEGKPIPGPWTAHKGVRTHPQTTAPASPPSPPPRVSGSEGTTEQRKRRTALTWFAWHGPYLALVLLGLLSIAAGLIGLGGSEVA